LKEQSKLFKFVLCIQDLQVLILFYVAYFIFNAIVPNVGAIPAALRLKPGLQTLIYIYMYIYI